MKEQIILFIVAAIYFIKRVIVGIMLLALLMIAPIAVICVLKGERRKDALSRIPYMMKRIIKWIKSPKSIGW